MGKIQINYEEVYTRTAQMKTYINGDLLERINSDYATIQHILDNVDSNTNAKLKEGMELHRQKAVIAARTLSKLLTFMSNSSKQVELNEQRIAGVIASGAMNTEGGV